MESSIAATAATSSVVVRTCVSAAVFLPSFSSSSFINPALRNGQAFRRCRCSSSFPSKQEWVSMPAAAARYVPGDDAFPEVFQWENQGMTLNEIAAAQGIQIRRRFHARYPSEGTGADRAVPRNILEQIIWDKEVELSQRKARTPVRDVRAAAAPGVAPPPRDFLGALHAARHRNGGAPALIAEVKKASPSKGLLRDHFDPVEIAQAYEKNGAACLSILTDEKHFQGSFDNLEAVRSSGVNCPLLCKEFVMREWQIYYARSKGADDAILLMAVVLPNIDIHCFLGVCRRLAGVLE